ncbi:MAG: class I SAM-dependent methyltransferase [Planctomycetota bacterium]|nr:class I SAM-dependent methyltransferase [Planctomycetota bacterium]
MATVQHSLTADIPLESLLARQPLSRNGNVLEYVNPDDDYCANFGDQWNRFRAIQIDSLSGHTESRDRFYAETGWKPGDLRGKILLDGGCGAGRFAEIAMEAGARVIAVDISEAINACANTLSRFPSKDYLLIRGSILDLPLLPAVCDGVYSLGVLQHTPDPLGGIRHLAGFVKPGGELATWIYERSAMASRLHWFTPRYWLRKLGVGKLPTQSKLRFSKCMTAIGFPFGWCLSWFGLLGERLSYFLPYAARHHLGRGSLRRQWDYCVMDTFDWYGPSYDTPQTEPDVRRAMSEAGLTDIRRTPARGMAIVGRKPVG